MILTRKKFENTNSIDEELNYLVNDRMSDRMHITDVCASCSHQDSRFMDYLIENNDKFDLEN